MELGIENENLELGINKKTVVGNTYRELLEYWEYIQRTPRVLGIAMENSQNTGNRYKKLLEYWEQLQRTQRILEIAKENFQNIGNIYGELLKNSFQT